MTNAAASPAEPTKSKHELAKEKNKRDREARLARREQQKDGIYEDDGLLFKPEVRKKKHRYDEDDESVDEEDFMEDGESEVEEKEDENLIDLIGKLNIVYERPMVANSFLVDRVKMVFKGLWKVQSEATPDAENLFLYQKVGLPKDEELLEEYFCTDRSVRV